MTVLLSLIQVPLFWHGWSISHEKEDILQLEPICVDVGQVFGTKTNDNWLPISKVVWISWFVEVSMNDNNQLIQIKWKQTKKLILTYLYSCC